MHARTYVRSLVSAAVLLPAAAWPGRLAAQYTEAPPPAAYALNGVTVVESDGDRREGVTLVVRGRFIEALAADAPVPADARVLEGDSLVAYPGLVDAQGTAKFAFPSEVVDRQTVASWDPPRALQGFVPHRRVVDALQVTGADLADQRVKGVVAAAVHPTGALMPGRGTLLLFRKDAARPDELVLTPVLGPVMSFRSARGVYPSTLFGVMAFYRQRFEDAARLRLVAREYERNPQRLTPPPYDPDMAVLQEIIGGGAPVFFHADGAEDIRRVLDLAERYAFRPIIVGGGEAWKVADRLKAADVPVLVSLDFPEPEYWKPEQRDTTAADTAAAEAEAEAEAEADLPDPAELREKKRLEELYANAAKLAAAGIRFALTSGGGEADLREGARKAIEYGLSESDALRALTSTPADLLGAPTLARIEVGLPATFVVANGPLFDEETRIVYTFVEGALEEGRAERTGEGAGSGTAGSHRAAGPGGDR